MFWGNWKEAIMAGHGYQDASGIGSKWRETPGSRSCMAFQAMVSISFLLLSLWGNTEGI